MSVAPPVQIQLQSNSDANQLERIDQYKKELGNRLVILGHHYQREEVIRFADVTGDSLKLSQYAATTDAQYIVFCGVHFMAETADILTGHEQSVILPDLAAGCSMADMANIEQVERCWGKMQEVIDPDQNVTPVTYINSTAAIKSFCGEHEGLVCTSSNAKKVLGWAWNRKEKVLFLPDQHLGENTAQAMGIPDHEMIVWDPFKDMGGNSPEDVRKAKIILWKGFCSVHQLFKPEHVQQMREKHPDIKVLTHPECARTVCEVSDFVGSTEAIIQQVAQSSSGQLFAIATELNLVNRLRILHPKNPIFFLSPTLCMCSTMFRTDPKHLCAVLESLAQGKISNQIKVIEHDQKWSKIALERMLRLA